MTKCSLALLIILAVFNLSYAQDSIPSIKLDYFDYPFRVKVDGGVDMYTYDTVNLDSHQYLLLVFGHIHALIKVPDKSGHIVLLPTSKKRPTGVIDTSTFIGNGYTIKLNTQKSTEIDKYHDLYVGTLTIQHGNQSRIIQIHGKKWVLRNHKKPSPDH